MIKTALFLMLLLTPASRAEEPEAFKPESLAPAYIPVSHPALGELTAALRAKKKTLGLNGMPGPAGKISRAVLLLPEDRSGAGVLSFELEKGDEAGIYQCEALGRGLTSRTPSPRWISGLLAGTSIYYAPKDMAEGATIPGVYYLSNISPDVYDIKVLGEPEPRVLALTARPEKTPKKEKRRFSAVWNSWYPPGSAAMPVDMAWAAGSQAGTQGKDVPVFELPPGISSPERASLRARQLSANPGYYRGPYGRYGFAVHTDLWEDPARLSDPKYADRPEKTDFRWRDTNGCVKLRPACLELLNKFIAEQEGEKRRVQLEVYETPVLNALPASPQLSLIHI